MTLNDLLGPDFPRLFAQALPDDEAIPGRDDLDEAAAESLNVLAELDGGVRRTMNKLRDARKRAAKLAATGGRNLDIAERTVQRYALELERKAQVRNAVAQLVAAATGVAENLVLCDSVHGLECRAALAACGNPAEKWWRAVA